jgi:hypothetical protein
MDQTIIISNIITALTAGFISAIIVHRLTIYRDLKNKRDELRIKYLIDAYRKLESVSNRDQPSSKEFQSTVHEFETAIADIQLFGTERQIKLCQSIASEFAEKRSVLLDDLLEDLRIDLRELLKLERLSSSKLIHLRWRFKK